MIRILQPWRGCGRPYSRTPLNESESVITLSELLKLEDNGQFPDEPVKIEEDSQIRSVSAQTY